MAGKSATKAKPHRNTRRRQRAEKAREQKWQAVAGYYIGQMPGWTDWEFVVTMKGFEIGRGRRRTQRAATRAARRILRRTRARVAKEAQQ